MKSRQASAHFPAPAAPERDRQRRQIAAIHRVVTATSSTLDLDEVLDALLDNLRSLSGADRVGVMLLPRIDLLTAAARDADGALPVGLRLARARPGGSSRTPSPCWCPTSPRFRSSPHRTGNRRAGPDWPSTQHRPDERVAVGCKLNVVHRTELDLARVPHSWSANPTQREQASSSLTQQAEPSRWKQPDGCTDRGAYPQIST